MRSIILIFFLLTGCSFNQNKDINNLSDINFLDNLSFKQFRIKLDEYAENNPSPNIDN
jgi:hypothetical protein|tara:strand:+ start:1584 stop:1757 length:174 start_codon:yes stop_codon:yes gene_type:complete